MPIGILSAMHEEIKLLHEQMTLTTTTNIGGRIYYEGTLWGHQVVAVFSRWGKVASSSTATTLIDRFKIDKLLFSGVAGAINPMLKIGDIVIGDKLLQHDMDASPLFDKYEIPLIGTKYFQVDVEIRDMLYKSAKDYISNEYLDNSVKLEFKIKAPTVLVGDIASGDKFISDTSDVENIRKQLPSILCVEMEGAAVAQICYEQNVPFGIIRTISDTSNENAHIDFSRFIDKVASHYTLGVLKEYF